MIVKVQLELFPGEVPRTVLINDEESEVFLMQQATPELLKLMGAEIKMFFYATVEGRNVVLQQPAPWQDW